MMKLLVLLLLLTSWSHLGSEARGTCDTGVALSGKILNIDGSQVAKANATFVHAYNCSSLQSCLEDCCLDVYGSCSVATYRNHSAEANCLHFYCQPLSKCKFFPSTFSDSFTFHEKTPSSTSHDKERLGLDVTTEVLKIFHITRDHPRSVSARKGVNNFLVSRKGVSPDLSILDSLSLKNDNTTIKPRKGVEEITESSTSVIKPRKGVEVEQYDFSETGSKIKPRKGVGPFLRRITPTQTSSTTPLTDYTPTAIAFKHESATASPSNLSKESELFSVLQNVFRDEVNISESSTTVPHTPISLAPYGSSTTGIIPTLSVSDVSISASQPDLQSSFSPTPTSAIPTSEVPQTTVHEAESTNSLDSEFKLTNKHISSAQSCSSSYGISAHETHDVTISTWVMPTRVQVTAYLNPTDITPSASTPRIVSSLTILKNSSRKESESHLKSASDVVESENERRYKSSMHLVISLVFGLLVLCAVMGAVAKRIYDVWLRRHYHRMDFLIDGLYDGYS